MNETITKEKHLDRKLGLLNAIASNMATMISIGPFITFPLIISDTAVMFTMICRHFAI